MGQLSSDPVLSLGPSPHLWDAAPGLGWGSCWGVRGGLWVFLLLKPKLLKLRKFLARLSGASNKLFITGCKRSQLRGPGLRSLDSQSATHHLGATHFHINNTQGTEADISPMGSDTTTRPRHRWHKGTLTPTTLWKWTHKSQSRHTTPSAPLYICKRSALLPDKHQGLPTQHQDTEASKHAQTYHMALLSKDLFPSLV